MVAVAAEDEEVEGGVVVAVVLAAGGDGKGIEKDVVIGKEEHAP